MKRLLPFDFHPAGIIPAGSLLSSCDPCPRPGPLPTDVPAATDVPAPTDVPAATRDDSTACLLP
jgi:hypothetical protein